MYRYIDPLQVSKDIDNIDKGNFDDIVLPLRIIRRSSRDFRKALYNKEYNHGFSKKSVKKKV